MVCGHAEKQRRQVLYALSSTHGGRKMRPGASAGAAGNCSSPPLKGAPAGRAAEYMDAVVYGRYLKFQAS